MTRMRPRRPTRPSPVAAPSSPRRGPRSAEKLFSVLVTELGTETGVTVGAKDKKAFGSGALKVKGKIFAMVSSKDRLVVKLPRQRVAALAADGTGVQFDPGHGRLMKEWLEVEGLQMPTWRALAREALAFVRH